MRKKSAVAILFAFIFIHATLFIGCSTDGTLLDNQQSIWCPQAQQYLTEEQCESLYLEVDSILCINKSLNVKGGFESKYVKNAALKVSHFTYNIAGSSVQNCDLKFLEYNDFKADSVELVRWSQHNVGNAFYICVGKTFIGLDMYKYRLKQVRETFNGVYNTDGICDGGGNPNAENFYTRFIGCQEYEIGDTFGIRKIVKN